MHRRPSLFKACVFLFAASAAAVGVAQAADNKLDSVLARGKLIVGTGSTNAPWHFQGADGKLQGFDIDIARMVAKGLFNDPSKVEFVVQSSDARIPNLLTDKVDMSCQFITVTASRAQQWRLHFRTTAKVSACCCPPTASTRRLKTSGPPATT